MKIAQVAPLYESVPPHLYGGTERVVSNLTEELVRAGHEVTLFASGDSITQARLVPCCETSLRLSPDILDPVAYHMAMFNRVFSEAEEFDVIHFHTDYLHFAAAKFLNLRHLTTLHGRLDLHDLEPLYLEYRDLPLVSISLAQRKPLPWVNWVANVYHGLPLDLLQVQPKAGDYLAFVGRISPEKRCDRAIRIAQRFGMPLRIAAKIDKVDRDYFGSIIKPLLGGNTEFVGEITDAEKSEFLGNAYAYLFPIDWPEPFGLTMIEAMACGTPTVAFRAGSVPEVLDENVTGFVVSGEDEAVQALRRVAAFDRELCRKMFEKRFSASRMACDYIRIYKRILRSNAWRKGESEQTGSFLAN
jgi:glycosyltransferase involved in cell wall biosynthesis